MTFKNLATRLALVASLVCGVLGLTGCPSKSQLDRAAEASNRLAGSTLTTVRVVREMYERGVIDDAVKDRLAGHLQKIAAGGLAFNALVVRLDRLEKQGALPADAWGQLAVAFAEVSQPLLALLEELRAITPEAASAVRVALVSTQAAVLVIAQLLDRQTARAIERSLEEGRQLARASPALRAAY